jgi:hypothetical protein
MFFIFAWALKDEKAFSESVPLDLIAESHRRHGSTVPISVVFLEGFSALSAGYRERLESQGLRLIDYTTGFQRIVAAFPNLNAAYSRYERNCFLRWIAFHEIYRGLPAGKQVWHLDGDVVLHTSTDAIAEDCEAKTFMLQGCPVLVSIANPLWFFIYQAELEKLEADIPGYSGRAQEHKAKNSVRDRELCNISLYRNPIGSDQDLLEYLISAGILMQEKADRIFDSRFYFVQNPLVARFWDDLQSTGEAVRIREGANGELFCGEKAIPFMHYQNEFCHYCTIYLTLAKVGLQGFTPNYVDAVSGGQGGIRLRFRILSKGLRMLGLVRPSRRVIIDRVTRRVSPSIPSRLPDIINQINYGSRK